MRIDFAELDAMNARARRERAQAVHGLISEMRDWIVSRIARTRFARAHRGSIAACTSSGFTARLPENRQ